MEPAARIRIEPYWKDGRLLWQGFVEKKEGEYPWKPLSTKIFGNKEDAETYTKAILNSWLNYLKAKTLTKTYSIDGELIDGN